MNDYDIIEIKLSEYNQAIQQEFENLSKDLQLIKGKIDAFELIIRGGCVVDILTNKKVKDVDVFYVLKDHKGIADLSCNCKKIKQTIQDLKLEFIGKKYEQDVGHYGTGEFWVPIVEKICGYFSHHADFRSMFVLTPEGKVFTNRKGLYCAENDIYEMTFNTWPMTQNFLDNNTGNYYDIYNGFTFRGVRHIVKKGLSPGPNFRMLLENWCPVLEMTLKTPEIALKMKNRFEIGKISIQDIVHAFEKHEIRSVKETERLLQSFLDL